MKRKTPVVIYILPLIGLCSIPQLGMSQSHDKKVKVAIGSKSFTESVLLAEIGTLAVKNAGCEARHRRELGGTQILFEALKNGSIDAYPEYTGTIAETILKDSGLRDQKEMRQRLSAIGIRMSQPFGFENGYAIGLKKTRAKELGISKISELAKLPNLRVGFSDEFMARPDGWPGMQKAYDLSYRTRGMDHAMSYLGINSGKLDLTDVYMTDADIAHYGLITLEDDKKYFPAYHAVWLYRTDLKERAPEAVKSLLALENKIDTKTMVALNMGSEVEWKFDHNLAAGFLNEHLHAQIPLVADGFSDRVWRRADELLWRTLEHLMLVAVSLSAAIVIAVPIGILSYRWKQFGSWILSAIGVLQTIPAMALLVALVPILSLGAAPAMVALFIYSLLPIVRNTNAGLAGISAAHRETAEVLGLSSRARLWMIELPLASPSIFSGIKTAAVINVGTATIGALVGAGGYGQPIITGMRLNNWGLILLGAIPAGLMAIGVQYFFSVIEKFVVPKGLRVA